MSIGGTDGYGGLSGLPPLVEQALGRARAAGFGHSCAPEQGRLLAVLARGRRGGRIGETGTGHGVGLAWMLDATGPGTSFVSIESDAGRASASAELFADHPDVTVRHGDWTELRSDGPFDLFVSDGGGGKGKEGAEGFLEPSDWVRVGGMLVMDDFAPAGTPGVEQHDRAREHWLGHPALRATEIRLTDDLATIVGVRVE